MEDMGICWDSPLDTRPTLLFIGTGRHGPERVGRYDLGNVWCIHLYRYRGVLRVRGHEFPIRPGHVSLTPPFITLEHQFEDRECVHQVAHFTLAAAPGGVPLPAMTDLGADFDAYEAAFVAAIGWFSTQPRRAEARVWDLLWRLAAPAAAPSGSPLHPAVRQVLELIELRLDGPLSVAELARAVDLSHGHLSRLFHAQMGRTVVGTLRDRRVQRAKHLLTYSSLSIKTIAAQVGIPDLHLFNKTVRQELGVSPRAYRQRVL